MIHLESVDIQGFKGLDSLQFEPSKINIITGRNNSGKTSLLEAVDVILQPSHIGDFGPNLSGLINHQYGKCKVSAVTPDSRIELHLTEPDEERIPDLLLRAFREELYDSWERLAPEGMPEEDVIEIIDSKLPGLLTDLLTQAAVEDANDETLVLTLNNEDFPYVYFGPAISELYFEIHDEIEEAILDEHHMKSDLDDLQTTFSEITLHHRFGRIRRGGFIEEQPQEIDSVNFLDFVQMSKTFDLSQKDADPVKVDNIGDFLREHEFVDDLKTFNLDNLVFEDDEGEKYSIPFEFMGEGFKAFVAILLELFDEDELENIVLFEEPETHMHPGYVRELIYFLIQIAENQDVQFFITTHNNDFLNDFFTENLTDTERQFLEDEFKLLQLQEGVADVMTYREAEEQLKDLHLDLRGL